MAFLASDAGCHASKKYITTPPFNLEKRFTHWGAGE